MYRYESLTTNSYYHHFLHGLSVEDFSTACWTGTKYIKEKERTGQNKESIIDDFFIVKDSEKVGKRGRGDVTPDPEPGDR